MKVYALYAEDDYGRELASSYTFLKREDAEKYWAERGYEGDSLDIQETEVVEDIGELREWYSAGLWMAPSHTWDHGSKRVSLRHELREWGPHTHRKFDFEITETSPQRSETDSQLTFRGADKDEVVRLRDEAKAQGWGTKGDDE